MVRSSKALQYTLLILVVCVAMSGCAWVKKSKSAQFLIPDMDTPREQFQLADRQFRDAQGIFDPETRDIELRKSVQAYESVSRRFPSDMRYTPMADLMIANIRLQIGEPRLAEAQYRRVLSQYSDDEGIRIDALIGLGQTLDQLGRPADAKIHYKMVIDQYAGSQDPVVRSSVEMARARYVQIREL